MTRISNKQTYLHKTPETTDDVFGLSNDEDGGLVRFDMYSLAELIRGINGAVAKSDFVYNETPSGMVNGINATFTSENNFVPGKVEVYVNGVLQKIIEDYQTIGNNTITLTNAPFYGENISLNYIKT